MKDTEMTLEELRALRAEAARKYKAVLEAAKADGNNFTAEVTETLEKTKAAIVKYESQIKALEYEDVLDAAEGESLTGISDNLGVSIDEATQVKNLQNNVFANFFRGTRAEFSDSDTTFMQRHKIANALSSGTDSEGGFLIPDTFVPQLMAAVYSYGGVREFARILKTAKGEKMEWPVRLNVNNAADIYAENVDHGDADDPVFGVMGLVSYIISSGAIPVPKTLIRDSSIDIVAEILDFLAEGIFIKEASWFTNGDGVDKPKGIVTAATFGKTTGSKLLLNWEEILDLKYSMNRRARSVAKNKGYLFNDQTELLAMKMKDANGMPMWSPSLVAGEPNMFFGDKYYVNDAMYGFGAANGGKTVMLYGDLGRYIVRDVGNPEIIRYDDSAYGKKGQVGFQIDTHADGDLIAPEGTIMKMELAA